MLEGLHDEAALDAERVVHGDEIVERAILDLEPATRIEREPLLRAKEMEMSVAGAGSQPRLRLARLPVRRGRCHIGHEASFLLVRRLPAARP